MIRSLTVIKTVAATITNASQTLVELGFDLEDEVQRADVALLTPDEDVRYRLDGEAPTSAIGHILKADTDSEIRGNDLLRLMELIRIGSSNVACTITLGKL